MDMYIFVILVVAMLIISASVIRTKSNKAYWRGRSDGWFACENMVLKRAEENENYDKQKVWEDLVQ